MTLSPWQKLLLLVPPAAALHAWEEVPRMPAWLAEHFPRLDLTPGAFAASAFCFAFLHAGSAALAWRARERGHLSSLFVLIQALVVLNVFSHVAGAFLYLHYSPGLFSALILNLPLPALIFRSALAAGLISGKKLLLLFAAAAALYLPAIFSSFAIGRMIVRLFP